MLQTDSDKMLDILWVEFSDLQAKLLRAPRKAEKVRLAEKLEELHLKIKAASHG